MFALYNTADIFLDSHGLLLFHLPKGSWRKSAKHEKIGKYVLIWRDVLMWRDVLNHAIINTSALKYTIDSTCCDTIEAFCLIISPQLSEQYVNNNKNCINKIIKTFSEYASYVLLLQLQKKSLNYYLKALN